MSTRMVWSFTGQGSAYAGMGKDLFASSPRFSQTVLKLQEICGQHGFPEFVDLISQQSIDLSTKSTVQTQLALVSLEIALADLWKSWGLQPALVIGHSLGEYAALCVSGVLSVSDTLYLVGKRATMIQDNCTPGSFAMLAVGSSCSTVENQLEMYPTCHISCINGPKSTVVSGPVADIKKLQEQLRINDCRSSLLNIPFGFHSAQINPILAEFKACAQGVHFAKPKIPVASTLEGSIITDSGVFNATYLVRQAREPVNFIGALEASKSTDIRNDETLWLEIGPNPVCLDMIRSTLGVPSSRLIPSLRKDVDNWKTLATTIASMYTLGAPISWADFHKDYVQSLELLDLPTYAFDAKDFWIQYSGDWALKGLKSSTETPKLISGPVIPGFPTTTVQGIESESFSDSSVSITFYSLIGQPDLVHAIHGHIVNGISICPSSVFVDMAYTAAKYIYQRVNPGKDIPSMAVSSLEINQPLIPRSDSPEQTLLITATKSSSADWNIEVTFASKEGSSLQKHGSCSVTFEKAADWKSNWSKTSYFIKTARDAIVNMAKSGTGHRLLKPIVYKLFANFVVYRSDYQAIDEVFLESDFGDAVANLKLKPFSGNSKFTFNPYWLDAIIHVAGFVLNGNVQNPDDVVYISTGFSNLRISEDLDENKSYTSYVHLQETDEKGNTTSDVYVFDGDRIIGFCAGLRFQRMKRNVLTAIFENSISGGSHAMVAKQSKEYRAPKRQIAEITPKDTTSSHSRSSSETGSDTNRSSSSVSSFRDDEEDESELVIAAVAEQTGFSKQEMLPTTRFADMGLDSLMSMEIIGILKKKSGMVLPAAFFNHNPTVADARRALGKAPEPNITRVVPSAKQTPKPNVLRVIPKSNIPPARVYESKVVLLQGRPSSKETPLFLITDGAGSATSYIHLPAFSSGLPLYALESPFLHDPAAFTCSITDVADMYIAAIRKTRPHGPYLIGGWSAGSAYAYEVSRKLLEMNEEIKGLILLDMHLPKKVSDLITPNMELLELTGLTAGVDRAGFSMAPMSNKLKEHLLSTMKALVDYEPIPMHPSRRPLRTFIIWARKGLTEVMGEAPPIFDKIAADKAVKSETKAWLFGDNDQEDDMETGMLAWFYGKRTNFGPNGWERMVGDKVDTFVVDCDHFSIVNPPHVSLRSLDHT
jgi:iterative type I PKS product template protein